MLNILHYLLIGAETIKLLAKITREHAMYNCPYEKQFSLKSVLASFRICPWDMFKVIVKKTLKENYNCLHLNGRSFGVESIRDTNIIFSCAHPMKIIASTI